jgi:hypothetical protein
MLLAPLLLGQSNHSNKSTAATLGAANTFLTEWLVNRDIDAAMGFVSASPILGRCALPPQYEGIKLAANDNRAAIESILRQVNAVTPPRTKLSELTERLGITPPDETNIAEEMPFELFTLTHGIDKATMLCKFDQTTNFRLAFKRPGVSYLVFRIKTREVADFDWVIAWVQEEDAPRILSVSPLEN